jgi:hypothetical protein
MIRWKPALNAFDLAFDGRLTAASSRPLHPVTPLNSRPSPRAREDIRDPEKGELGAPVNG